MTIVRMGNGALFVHSPVGLDPTLRATVDALGPVRAIVAPSLFHHMYVAEWTAAYPAAVAFCCPGLERKRSDLSWSGVLGDTADPAWAGELEQVYFSARSLENEVVFFHPASKTLICADMLFNLSRHTSRLTRAVAWVLGNHEPGATRLERVMIRKREAAREQLQRMLAWDAERIVLAHGALVESDGREVLRRAYAWL
jgi:hypothetical protein